MDAVRETPLVSVGRVNDTTQPTAGPTSPHSNEGVKSQ